jgi:hypothetical protein
MVKAGIKFCIETSIYNKAAALIPRRKIGYCIGKFFEAMLEGRVSVFTEEELDMEIEKTLWRLNHLEKMKRSQYDRV